MGQLVFQANSGGQTNLVGQNTASTFNLNIPLANGTLVSTGDTATVTSAMISGPVTTAKGGTGLTSFTSGGAVYATSTSALTTGTLPTSAGGTNLTSFTANGVLYASSSSALTTGSALVFDGTNFAVGASPLSGVKAYFATQAGNNTVRLDCGPGGSYISDLTFGAYGFGAVAGLRFEDANALLRMYGDATRALAFNANGSEQMRLTSTGLGIGTSSPASGTKLTLQESASNPTALALLNRNSTQTWKITVDASAVDDKMLAFIDNNTSTVRLALTDSGNLGLGVTPSAWFSTRKAMQIGGGASLAGVSSSAGLELRNNAYLNTGGSETYLNSAPATLYASFNGEHRFYNAPSGTAGNAITFTQSMTLDASGNLLVGQTGTTTGKISVQQTGTTACFFGYQSNGSSAYGYQLQYATAFNNTANEAFYFADGSVRATIRSNGGIANYSANNVNLSDRREKTNFAPAKSYLNVICAIPVQTYNYIDQNMKEDDGLTLGVVAQDVQAVAPELVNESDWSTEKDGSKMRLSIYQTDMQYALMKCIQELSAQVTALQTQVTALKG